MVCVHTDYTDHDGWFVRTQTTEEWGHKPRRTQTTEDTNHGGNKPRRLCGKNCWSL